MRSIIISSVIILLLVSVFCAEYLVVEKFFDKLRTDVAKMKKSVINGEMIEEDVADLVGCWEKSKGILYFFENHEYFGALEDSVYSLRFSVRNNEKRNVLFYLEKINVMCDESEYDFSLAPGNIF